MLPFGFSVEPVRNTKGRTGSLALPLRQSQMREKGKKRTKHSLPEEGGNLKRRVRGKDEVGKGSSAKRKKEKKRERGNRHHDKERKAWNPSVSSGL